MLLGRKISPSLLRCRQKSADFDRRSHPGDLTVDATAASPAYSALRASRARALPLLRSAADLGKLDGACRDRFPK